MAAASPGECRSGSSTLAIGDREKVGLAERPDRQNVFAGDRLGALGFEIVIGLLAPCAATSAETVSRRSNRAGIDLIPSFASSLEVGTPLGDLFGLMKERIITTFRVSIFFRIAIQHPIDEFDGLLGAEGPCELQGFVDDDRRRRLLEACSSSPIASRMIKRSMIAMRSGRHRSVCLRDQLVDSIAAWSWTVS